MKQTEVLIVGGGPAGAACAWALRRQGVDCLILDRETFPRLKLCAGWITPDVLEDLELEPEAYPHGLTTLSKLRLSVRGLALTLPARQMAIRRIEFDAWLLERAGVPVETHHVRDIVRREGGYVVDDAYFARYLVGAGGTHCPVARAFFDDVNPRSPDNLIVTQEEEFVYAGPTRARDTCYLWFFEHGLPGYAWFVPKVGSVVNVGVGGKAQTLKGRGETIQEHWARLVAELDRLGLVRDHSFQPKGHAYYLRGPRPELRSGNAFVVGDAAGLATADLGEGIAAAVRSGLLVANAIARNEACDVGAIRAWSQPRWIGRLLAAAYG
ncbi:MAG: NAD(P)/FAD-dependent oxidoreductase [Anaerolineae bacterium]